MKREYELCIIIGTLLSVIVMLVAIAATMPSRYDRGYNDGLTARNIELDKYSYYAYKCNPEGQTDPVNFVVITLLPHAVEPEEFRFVEPEDNATIVCILIGPAAKPDIIG